MAPWFSASAVAPTLTRIWHLSPTGTAWLTVSVQLGFVFGALTSAVLTLADRWSARRLVAGAAALAGLPNPRGAPPPPPGVAPGVPLLPRPAPAGRFPPPPKAAGRGGAA